MSDLELELYAKELLQVWLDCPVMDVHYNWNIQTTRRKAAWKRVARFMVECEADLTAIRDEDHARWPSKSKV